MLLILLIGTLLFVVVMEAPRLIYQKLWRELAAFFFLWGFASALAIAQFMGVDLNTPLQLLSKTLVF